MQTLPLAAADCDVPADLDAGRVLDDYRPAVQALFGAVVEFGAAQAEKWIVIEVYPGQVLAAKGNSPGEGCDVLPPGLELLSYSIGSGKQVADAPLAATYCGVPPDLDAGRVLDDYRPAVQALFGAVVEFGAAQAEKWIVIEVHAGPVIAAEGHSLGERCDVLPDGFELLSYSVGSGKQVADTPLAAAYGGVPADLDAGRVLDDYRPAVQALLGAVVELGAAQAEKRIVIEVYAGAVSRSPGPQSG